jgi:hypothetical protein
MAARAKAQPVEQKPASPPARVEVRINGKVKFVNNECYDISLTVVDDVLTLKGALHPTLVNVTPPRPPARVEFGGDPRDGDTVIEQVHSGSRKSTATAVAAPSPKKE